MNRKLFLLILVFGFASKGFAQADTSLLYLRFPTLPPFKITKVPDSTVFTKDDLPKKRATMIMIFSPDCEHCQHETRELIAHMDLFKKVQIIMTSPLEYYYLNKFYEDFGIAQYPNITIGRDPGYFLGTFYKVHSFPSIFLYDKKGNFVKSFDGSVPVEKIAEAL
jgi:thioredoxin-related protein